MQDKEEAAGMNVPDAAAHELQKTIDHMTGYSKRTRRLVRALAVVFAAVVVLVGVVFWLSIDAHNEAATLHQDQLNNCAASNAIRMKDRDLWTTFIVLLEGPHPDAQVKAVASHFLSEVTTTFATVNCERAYPK